MNFQQIYSTGVFWDTSAFGVRGQIQGHGRIKYAGNSILQADAYTTQCLASSSWFLVFTLKQL